MHAVDGTGEKIRMEKGLVQTSMCHCSFQVKFRMLVVKSIRAFSGMRSENSLSIKSPPSSSDQIKSCTFQPQILFFVDVSGEDVLNHDIYMHVTIADEGEQQRPKRPPSWKFRGSS
jgi:hypothetical protein